MQPADIVRLFGEPAPDAEGDEDFNHEDLMLDYPHPAVAMEFEFNRDGTLTYWHVFEPARPR
jgi:hypothetical protein